MRLLLETLGGVPEAVLNSNNPLVMSAYLQGRMHSPSGAAPGGENSSLLTTWLFRRVWRMGGFPIFNCRHVCRSNKDVCEVCYFEN